MLCAAAALVFLATPALAQDKVLVERGRALLERNCSSCHAIGEDGASPLPAATAFRDIKQKYPVEALAEPLAEGIETGHPQMPTRAFAPEDVDAILAYLETL
ncbi:MAG TPA: cytochrome c [Geminicoccaceae bacterium]|nr:cytochrome c [Geminicoccus sp.]HMU48778.1 cytochrome c [Geminicoccaceae bacterium]